MRNVIFVFVVMFSMFFVSCGGGFETADHIVLDKNGNKKFEDGYLGGICLKGDICIEKEAECEKGYCVEKEAEVSDDVETSDEEVVSVPELSESDCEGLEITLSQVPFKVVFFGAEGEKDVYTQFSLKYKALNAGDYVKYACSAIAYDLNNNILTPVECGGVQGNEACASGPCNGGNNGTEKVCAWDCNPFKCEPLK